MKSMQCHLILARTIIYLIFILSKYTAIQCTTTNTAEQGNFIQNFNKGLKIASNLFAGDVANLVTEAFAMNTFTNKSNTNYIDQKQGNHQQIDSIQQNIENTNNTTTNTVKNSTDSKQEYHSTTTNYWDANNLYENLNPKLITNILRLVGFDIKKLGNFAIHIIIIIAQAIAKGIISIATTNDQIGSGSPVVRNGRTLENDKTFDWLFRHPSLNTHQLLHQAMDGSLDEKIITMIGNYEQHVGQMACLQLLICKCSPFIRGMQQSLSKWLLINTNEDQHNRPNLNISATANITTDSHAYNVQSLFNNFPTLIDYQQHENQCESIYTQYCNMSFSPIHN